MLLSYFIEHNRYGNLIGIFVVILIAFLCSRKRSAINYRLIASALSMQVLIAFGILRTNVGFNIVNAIAHGVTTLYSCAENGAQFLFGNLTNPTMAWGFIFAFKVLPIIIFFGALMSLLFYMGIVQRVVTVVSYAIRPIFGTSGAETVCAIANSFLGQTEAPLLIRNYLPHMTKSELLLVMVSGMGTISGAILAVFAAMGIPAVHLLTASVMAIPGTILIAKILYPETEQPATAAGVQSDVQSPANTFLDAIAMGTTDGLYLALNVAAMLLSFISLIALLNFLLALGSGYINSFVLHCSGIVLPQLSLGLIFSYLFAPFGYLLGFSGNEAFMAGQLLGMKVTINELIAYGELLRMNLSERSVIIMTYALCGFANFSCIGIQIGGIGALMPEKRAWLSELGLLAVLGGSLSNLLSAMIIGLLL